MWRSWTIGFLGLWIIFIALVLHQGTTLKVLLVLSGLVIVLISFSKILSEHYAEEQQGAVLSNLAEEQSEAQNEETQNV